MAGFQGPGPAQAAAAAVQGTAKAVSARFNPAITNFLKSNWKFAFGGAVGLGFLGLSIADIANSDNKFKALLKTVKDFILIRVAMVGTFTAFRGAIQALARDTGSLQAALDRLNNVQKYTRIFTALTGGAKAAKQHVADLLNFAAKTPFKFEGVAEADRSLQTLTRGSYAGTKALQTIGDAAAASGNSLAESATAVGGFYEALHNGEPVNRATEQMRQMGLVSDLAAQHMDRLTESGASSTEMADSLTQALQESRGGMSAYSDDLEALGAAHEKASEQAKAAFGKGFAAPNVKALQNSTATLVAMAPALERVGKFLSSVTNGLGNLGGKILRAAAESKVLGTALEVIAAIVVGAVAAFTVFGLTAIPAFIAAVYAATASLGAFGLALTFATAGISAVIALVAILGVGAGAYGLYKWSKEATTALRDLKKAHREAQAEINAHAAAIKDLTDLQEQYGRSVSNLIDLQIALNKAIEEGASPKTIKELKRAIQEARMEMSKLPSPGSLASKERGAVIAQHLQERLQGEEATFREQMAQHPERGTELRGQRAAVLEQRAEEGRGGLVARQRAAEATAGYMPKKAIYEEESILAQKNVKLGKDATSEEKRRYNAAQTALAQIEDKTLAIQETEGKGHALGTEAQLKRIEAARHAGELEAAAATEKSDSKKKEYEDEAKIERIRAGGVKAGPETSRREQVLRAQLAEQAERETTVTETAGQARGLREEEIEAKRGRGITTMQVDLHSAETMARLTGNTIAKQRAQDMGAFLEKFQSFKQQGFTEAESRQLALQERGNELLDQVPASMKPVADSLTRMGGGGGAGGPTGDPKQRTQERISQLAADSNRLLAIIAANTAGDSTGPGGQPSEEVELGEEDQAKGKVQVPSIEDIPLPYRGTTGSWEPPNPPLNPVPVPIVPSVPPPPGASSSDLPSPGATPGVSPQASVGEGIRAAIGGLPQTAMMVGGGGSNIAAAAEAADKALTPQTPREIEIPQNLPGPGKHPPGIRKETLETLGIDQGNPVSMAHTDWGFVKQFQEGTDREAASSQGRVAANAPAGYDYNLGTGQYVSQEEGPVESSEDRLERIKKENAARVEAGHQHQAQAMEENQQRIEAAHQHMEKSAREGRFGTKEKRAAIGRQLNQPNIDVSTLSQAAQETGKNLSQSGQQQPGTDGSVTNGLLKGILQTNKESVEHLSSVAVNTQDAQKAI